jgi:hypothetical protein
MDQKNLLVERRHNYGEKFFVIVPEKLPYPTMLDPQKPDIDVSAPQ